MKEDKSDELRSLSKEITNCLKCYEVFRTLNNEDRVKVRDLYVKEPWSFPPDEFGVKGLFGIGDIMFVCPRPSTGSFDDKASKLFYNLLKNMAF